MALVIYGNFEWDDAKAAANVAKHGGVTFEEASTVFADQNVLIVSDGADRLLAIGFSAAARVLTVVHLERGERDRIISARLATSNEQNEYAQQG